MIIRKLFKFEGAHIVRNCSTDRCKKSIHGHSYKVEVLLEADALDNGFMVYDFSLFKNTIKDFIDSFDHAYSIWNVEKTSFIDFIKEEGCERWVEMPISPSAEGYAVMMASVIDNILKNTEFGNDEDKELKLHSVIVHETDTGYAQAFQHDLYFLFNKKYTLKDIVFSKQVRSEWNNPLWWDFLLEGKSFINKKIKKTHDI